MKIVAESAAAFMLHILLYMYILVMIFWMMLMDLSMSTVG